MLFVEDPYVDEWDQAMNRCLGRSYVSGGANLYSYSYGSGPGVIAGVGTGDTKSPEPYQATQRSLFNGRALVIVRSAGKPGPIKLTAKSKGLSETSVTLNAEAGPDRQ